MGRNKKKALEGDKMDKIDYYTKANKKITWLEIKSEYENTEISQKKLAEKYKKSFGTLRDRARKGRWKKNLKELDKKIKEKTIEKIAEKASEATLKHFNISNILLEEINKSSKNNDLYKYVEKIKEGHGEGCFSESLETITLDTINDKKLLNIVSSFEKIQKLQRQSLGILDKKDEEKLNMDKFNSFLQNNDEEIIDILEKHYANKIEEYKQKVQENRK